MYWRITIFTREYGKVNIWYKKTGTPDIGSYIRCHIDRKENHNHVKDLNVRSVIPTNGWSYIDVLTYLELLASLLNLLPEGQVHSDIYDDLVEYHKWMRENPGTSSITTLIHLRCINQLGHLCTHNIRHPISQYICSEIKRKKIQTIIHAKPIITEVTDELKGVIGHSLHLALHN